jgi:hypothetical protein
MLPMYQGRARTSRCPAEHLREVVVMLPDGEWSTELVGRKIVIRKNNRILFGPVVEDPFAEDISEFEADLEDDYPDELP